MICGAGGDTPRRGCCRRRPSGDFEVEVKFASAPTAAYQMQGLVVEQDADDLLRVGVHRDGDGVRLFVAAMVERPR